jgi:hypothetical protein
MITKEQFLSGARFTVNPEVASRNTYGWSYIVHYDASLDVIYTDRNSLTNDRDMANIDRTTDKYVALYTVMFGVVVEGRIYFDRCVLVPDPEEKNEG